MINTFRAFVGYGSGVWLVVVSLAGVVICGLWLVLVLSLRRWRWRIPAVGLLAFVLTASLMCKLYYPTEAERRVVPLQIRGYSQIGKEGQVDAGNPSAEKWFVGPATQAVVSDSVHGSKVAWFTNYQPLAFGNQLQVALGNLSPRCRVSIIELNKDAVMPAAISLTPATLRSVREGTLRVVDLGVSCE